MEVELAMADNFSEFLRTAEPPGPDLILAEFLPRPAQGKESIVDLCQMLERSGRSSAWPASRNHRWGSNLLRKASEDWCNP
jgi:hypothetical protein